MRKYNMQVIEIYLYICNIQKLPPLECRNIVTTACEIQCLRLQLITQINQSDYYYFSGTQYNIATCKFDNSGDQKHLYFNLSKLIKIWDKADVMVYFSDINDNMISTKILLQLVYDPKRSGKFYSILNKIFSSVAPGHSV